jgi:uncharacterized MAPEG superfamily protein
MIHFSLAYWCVLAAAVLPIVCTGIAKSGRFVSLNEGGYDNRNPRDWLAQQTQWRGRANAAQANSFEALPFFIGAVVIAHQLGTDQNWLDLLAALFITLRVVYVGLYVGGLANARSLVWTGAFATNIAILFIGYR